MDDKTAIVVTSISAPNAVMRDIAKGSSSRSCRFIVIGDVPSPADFELAGCEFHSLDKQMQMPFGFAAKCPRRHYARKNIGYLLAVAGGAQIIVETDDDNYPMDAFWGPRSLHKEVSVLDNRGWANIYSYFSDENLWPRGFDLAHLRDQVPARDMLPVRRLDCPIQQGLADENPDVDAIYRLSMPLPVRFTEGDSVAITAGTWCPFNSQNTTWWPQAFELLYLPAYCSFRMTDIWRSFVAQRIATANGWGILFHQATVWQERNEHNLMRDFADEVPGYLNNGKIVEALAAIEVCPGVENNGRNLRACYGKLVEMGLVGAAEMELLDAWLADLAAARGQR